jgi:hypothetical protein
MGDRRRHHVSKLVGEAGDHPDERSFGEVGRASVHHHACGAKLGAAVGQHRNRQLDPHRAGRCGKVDNPETDAQVEAHRTLVIQPSIAA